MSKDLRSANKKLLDQLKKSQEEISKLIVAVKHSDPRVLDAVPLTSTLANCNKNVTFQRTGVSGKRTLRWNHKAPSSGILKRKSPTSKRLSSPSKNACVTKTPEKTPTFSRFLQSRNEKKCEGGLQQATDTSLLTSPGNYRPTRSSRVGRASPVQIRPNNENQPVQVTFKTPDNHQHVLADGDHSRTPPPMLGYDWIAGVVENSQPSPNYSETFIEEMKEFRKLNRSECHSAKYWNEMQRTPKTPIDSISPCRHYKVKQRTPDPSDTRDPRIINFTINKRLFPVPVDPSENVHPGSEASPRYIRVSVPKSSLLSPYRYRAMHRSTYTDGFDSLALPDHCVMGWQHTVPKDVEKKQSVNGLDLRSSLRPKENLVSLQLKSGQACIPVKNEGKALSFLQDSMFCSTSKING